MFPPILSPNQAMNLPLPTFFGIRTFTWITFSLIQIPVGSPTSWTGNQRALRHCSTNLAFPECVDIRGLFGKAGSSLDDQRILRV